MALMIPPRFKYHVGGWSYDHKDIESTNMAEHRVNVMAKDGWDLICVSAGLAYWRRDNPEYLKYLEDENKRVMSRIRSR